MKECKLTYYKEVSKLDNLSLFRKNSKIFMSNLFKSVLTIKDPMQLVIIGHLYFDYLFYRALEELNIPVTERRYQSFRNKLDKLNELEQLTPLQYNFFLEINQLRNHFAHNIFFDITSWNPLKLPQVRKYKLIVPKRKDLLGNFITVQIQTGFFTIGLELSKQHHWLAFEDIPKK